MVTTYGNWRVGDVINICASIDEFCGSQYQFIYPKDINVTKSSVACGLAFGHEGGCGLHLSNVEFTFKLVKVSGGIERKICSPQQVYKTIGSAITYNNGATGVIYTVTEQDRLNYAGADGLYKVMACITNADGNATESGNISIVSSDITVTKPPEPTHSVTFGLNFVPGQLMDYFGQYIADISNKIMGKLPALPAPWQYLKTTYDKNLNEFKMWYYLPGYASQSMMGLTGTTIRRMGWIDDAENALMQWVRNILDFMVPVILGILAVILWYLGFPILLPILLGASAIAYYFRITEEKEKRKIAEESAKNANAENQGRNTGDEGKKKINEEWENSNKDRSACIKRLENFRDLQIGIIDGYINKYSQYASLVTELNTEKGRFSTEANFVINEFKTKQYTVDTCNEYYIKIDNKVNDSNLKLHSSIVKYTDPGKTYETPCTGYSTKVACESAGCNWYNNKCSKEAPCWIPNPAGGCILSEKTGKTIVYVGATGVGLYAAYKIYQAIKPEKPAKVEIIGGKI